jgi:hypothetical protein
MASLYDITEGLSIPHQAAQDGQVLYVVLHIRAFGRFQQHWVLAKAEVVDQQPEAVQANMTLADVLVTIHPAAQVALRVVDVKDP